MSIEGKKSFYEVSLSDLDTLGFEKSFTKKQVWDWVYKKYVSSFDKMTNVSKVELEKLQTRYFISSLKIHRVIKSQKDSTQKILFQTHDEHIVEAVLIADKDNKDYTLCLSSQVGCTFDCTFCATGKLKFRRSLKGYEIVEQYALLQELTGDKVKNIVYMGMGEPFAIGRALYESFNILCGEEGFALGDRHLSISTIGVVDKIRDFADYPRKHHLLISLHSAIQAKRDKLMPNMKNQPLTDLKQAIAYYNEKKKKKVMLEYILLDGINDTREDALALKKFSRGLGVKVNLIAYNETGFKGYKASPSEQIFWFKKELETYNMEVVQRYKKGDDIKAACGQLAGSK